MRDGYSNFGFFQEIFPRDYDMQAGGAITGNTIDCRGYETVTFVVNVGTMSLSTTVSIFSAPFVRMQHGESNAAGTVVWSCCQASHMLFDITHSLAFLSGMSDASYGILCLTSNGSGVENGVFLHLGVSAVMVDLMESHAYVAGYIGGRRWARLMVSCSAVNDVSTIEIGAIAILGLEADWPVNHVRRSMTEYPNI